MHSQSLSQECAQVTESINCRNSDLALPMFQLGVAVHVRPQLLDEREQHVLLQRARLAEYMAGVGGRARVHHEAEVRCTERLLEGGVRLPAGQKLLDLILLNLQKKLFNIIVCHNLVTCHFKCAILQIALPILLRLYLKNYINKI